MTRSLVQIESCSKPLWCTCIDTACRLFSFHLKELQICLNDGFNMFQFCKYLRLVYGTRRDLFSELFESMTVGCALRDVLERSPFHALTHSSSPIINSNSQASTSNHSDEIFKTSSSLTRYLLTTSSLLQMDRYTFHCQPFQPLIDTEYQYETKSESKLLCHKLQWFQQKVY